MTKIKVSKKTRKNLKWGVGGKTLSSSEPVKLTYEQRDINCEICGSNNYTENTGTLNKSKVRSGLGHMFFGDIADVVDNTSVIIYTCNKCSYCRMVRNLDKRLVIANKIGNV